MSRRFCIPKDPHETGESIYAKSRITIKPGLTVLVGCNGSGKSTLIRHIGYKLKKLRIPFFDYDNLFEGGKNAKDWALQVSGNMNLLIDLATSSEGEQIYINFGEMCRKLGLFVRTNAMEKELWIMLDAIDSGLSIDYIDELKGFLKDMVIGGNKDKDVYILVSANAYELCRDEWCFDVHNGVYTSFKDYEDYRDFVLRSRERKDKRGVNS